MKFLYSGASKIDAVQIDPILSLGGHISSSPIPNDSLQNIFSEASYLSIQQKTRETKMIVLKNNNAQEAGSIELNFAINTSSIGKYKIAFVEPDANGCFEQIINSSALPFYATFQDIVDATPISLPNIVAGDYLGIWLVREYDFTSDDLMSHDKAYWASQLLTPTTLDIKDSLSLVLNYTLL